MPARICVVGSFNADLTAKVASFPRPGETVTASRFSETSGGKGSNQAVAAARCGARVSVIAALGADPAGERALALWRAEGIDAGAVARRAGVPTGSALILVDGKGENEIVIVAGANATLDRADVEVGRSSIDAAQIVLGQLEVSVAATLAAFRIAKAGKAMTILNPAPADATIPEALWRCIDILTPNRLEAVRLAGSITDARPEAVARELVLLHGCAVVMTLGGDGVLVAETAGSLTRIPAPRIALRETTGAGDAFNGVFATRLAETGDMVEAARWGVVAGALACTGDGATAALPLRAAIESRLAGITAESVG
ncbi:MAG TPA: ribokinase [Stellaceae bacterium]|jgi:ribokinase|nr:ribokinase [Stellaceae bacterium]